MSPQDLSYVQRALSRLQEVSAEDGNVQKKEDIARRLDELYDKLSTGQLKAEEANKVLEMVQAMEVEDYEAADKLHLQLCQVHWELHRSWLLGVKRLILHGAGQSVTDFVREQARAVQALSQPGHERASSPPPPLRTSAASSSKPQEAPAAGPTEWMAHPMPPKHFDYVRKVLCQLQETAAQDGNMKKKEDIAQRLGELYSKLSSGQIKTEVALKVLQLVQALDTKEYSVAHKVHHELCTMDWELHKSWLWGVKCLLHYVPGSGAAP